MTVLEIECFIKPLVGYKGYFDSAYLDVVSISQHLPRGIFLTYTQIDYSDPGSPELKTNPSI